MMSLCLWSVLAFAAMLSTVRCHYFSPILSQVNSDQGPQPFNITCDLNRVEFKPDKGKYTAIVDIEVIYRCNRPGSSPSYRSLYKALKTSASYKTGAPAGRKWKVSINVNLKSTNYYQQYVNIQVNDPRCADQGSYSCRLIITLKDKTRYILREKTNILKFGKCK